MLKLTFFLCCFLFSVQSIIAEGLVETYRSGTLKLKSDPDYGSRNNWNELFCEKPVSKNPFKGITVSDDGSVYLIYNYKVIKFDREGNYEKEFCDIRKMSRYSNITSIDILDKKYILTALRHGIIRVYDTDGNFVKQISRDFMLSEVIALKNNKFAYLGIIVLKNGKFKEYVGIMDMKTEKEIEAIHFINPETPDISIHVEGNERVSISKPRYHFKAVINRTTDGNLIVSHSKNPEIQIFSPEGRSLSRVKLTYDPLKIKAEEKKKYYRQYKKLVSDREWPDSVYEKIRKLDFFPEHLPYYYNVIVDSESNILVFKYTDDTEHVFQVYQVYNPDGKFICESEIDPGEYEPPLIERKRIKFHNGNLYTLAKLTKADGCNIRLIRCGLK